MTRILGLIDILAGLLLVVVPYGLDVPRGMMIAVGVILAVKGLLFIMNFFSWIDVAVGILLIFAITSSLPIYVSIGLAAFLGLKGLASLFAFS